MIKQRQNVIKPEVVELEGTHEHEFRWEITQ